MFKLNISGAIFGGNTNFGFQVLYFSSGSISSIANYSLDAGETDINCVGSFLLTKTSSDPFGFKFPSTLMIGPI
jgi:hypothetical protein